ncbi:unnamed protein product, partial [Iphiclides podalirius]
MRKPSIGPFAETRDFDFLAAHSHCSNVSVQTVDRSRIGRFGDATKFARARAATPAILQNRPPCRGLAQSDIKHCTSEHVSHLAGSLVPYHLSGEQDDSLMFATMFDYQTDEYNKPVPVVTMDWSQNKRNS